MLLRTLEGALQVGLALAQLDLDRVARQQFLAEVVDEEQAYWRRHEDGKHGSRNDVFAPCAPLLIIRIIRFDTLYNVKRRRRECSLHRRFRQPGASDE